MKKTTATEFLESFESGKRAHIKFYCLNNQIFEIVGTILVKMLSKLDMLFFLKICHTVLTESINNAVKANAKRVYFDRLQAGDQSGVTYAEKMVAFKDDVMSDVCAFSDDLRKEGRFVTLTFHKLEDHIKIIVTNNTAMLPEEEARIAARMAKISEYDEIFQAYDDCLDLTEGAGLGIVIVLFMLKQSGIDPKSFTIRSDGKVTQTAFNMPLQFRPVEVTNAIKQQLLSGLDMLPTFPQNITELMHYCKSENASFKEISKKVIGDPALTANVLMIANSAAYGGRRQIQDISQAVVKIGIKSLEQLLMVAGARGILDRQHEEVDSPLCQDSCPMT